MTSGKYIVIEGGDGTGKTTQVMLLAKYLGTKGIETYIPQEPAGTPFADELRKVILNATLARDGISNLLLFTTTRRSIWQEIHAKLEQGIWVIASRNYLSTLAYQGYGEGVDKDLIIQTTKRFVGERYLTPDQTIILLLQDAREHERRIAKRGVLENPDTFESRGKDFHISVNDAYQTIATQYVYQTVDASRPIGTIQSDIRRLLNIID